MKASQALGCACFVVSCWASVAAAQTLADPEHRPEIEHAFESAPHAQRLRCEIRPILPALNYHMQFQTGYRVTAGLDQFDGGDHHLTVYLRVTPVGREPVYLSTSGDIPHALAANA